MSLSSEVDLFETYFTDSKKAAKLPGRPKWRSNSTLFSACGFAPILGCSVLILNDDQASGSGSTTLRSPGAAVKSSRLSSKASLTSFSPASTAFTSSEVRELYLLVALRHAQEAHPFHLTAVAARHFLLPLLPPYHRTPLFTHVFPSARDTIQRDFTLWNDRLRQFAAELVASKKDASVVVWDAWADFELVRFAPSSRLTSPQLDTDLSAATDAGPAVRVRLPEQRQVSSLSVLLARCATDSALPLPLAATATRTQPMCGRSTRRAASPTSPNALSRCVSLPPRPASLFDGQLSCAGRSYSPSLVRHLLS